MNGPMNVKYITMHDPMNVKSDSEIFLNTVVIYFQFKKSCKTVSFYK